jgi:hypothetical protein
MPDPIRSLGPTPECPSLDALTAATPDRTELAMFQGFQAAEPRPEETVDLAWVNAELDRRRSAAKPKITLADHLRAWITFPRLSFAAAGLVALLAVIMYLPTRNQSTLPDQQETSQWRSGQITAIAPTGDQEHPPTVLRWEPVAGAASYHVRLLEVDGTEIWSADVDTSTVEFPSSVAAKMIPGRAFQWECIARDAAGRAIASSNLQSFHNLATQR